MKKERKKKKLERCRESVLQIDVCRTASLRFFAALSPSLDSCFFSFILFSLPSQSVQFASEASDQANKTAIFVSAISTAILLDFPWDRFTVAGMA